MPRIATSILGGAVLLCSISLMGAIAQAAPPVTFELFTEDGFPITGAQQWGAVLNDVGISSVRIRGGRVGDKGEVKNLGTDEAPRFHVTGMLTAQNTLRVPGGTFRPSQKAEIAAWVEKLQLDGVEGLTAKPGAFGLTGKQLVDVHEKLAARVTFTTRGETCSEVVRGIGELVSVDIVLHDSARAALAGDETVPEEMLGLSCGTALAAVIRPLGLVAVPFRPRGGETQIVIGDSRRAEESWPIGWPLDQSPSKTMPDLFKFLNVEIDDVALSDGLSAIQERLKVPFLYDHNSMARHEVDLTQIKVSLPEGRTYYKKVLDRLLAQAKPERMKAELRVDEAGQPFMWITTLKQ